MRKVAWQKFRLVDGDFVSNTTFLSHFIPLPPLTPYYSSFLYSFVLNILYFIYYIIVYITGTIYLIRAYIIMCGKEFAVYLEH